MELVSSVVQLLDNIKLYNEHADRFAELMPYNRSWYALRTDVGWLLGPSKYIGYQNLSPEEYLGSLYSAEKRGRMVQHNKSALPLDGRVTEGVLKRWSVLVEEGHPDHESLHSALNALCARYARNPTAWRGFPSSKKVAKRPHPVLATNS